MGGITRRTTLGLLGTTAALGLAGGATARDNGRRKGVRRVLSTGSPVPENLAFDEDGNLYVGITGGSVRKLSKGRTDETGLDLSATTEVATYPGGVAGVLVVDDMLYTAVNGDSGSVYQFELDDDDEGPTELATILPDGNGFVNDLYHDEDEDRLLVTESFGGTVYEVSLDDGDTAVWVQDDLLDTESFGVNGITRICDDVYVTVTRAGDVGRIVRIPVESDGSAGTPEVFVESEALFGADGLAARCKTLYVAVNSQNRITRVNRAGELKTVLEGGMLSFPSEVVFDPTARKKMFICNFSPEAPADAGVLRARVRGNTHSKGKGKSHSRSRSRSRSKSRSRTRTRSRTRSRSQ